MPNNETAEYCLAAIMPIISNGGEQLDEDSDYEYGIVWFFTVAILIFKITFQLFDLGKAPYFATAFMF